MGEEPSSRPKLTSRTVTEKATRTDRLASEMRKNLMKRKRQQRDKVPDGDGHPSRPENAENGS